MPQNTSVLRPFGAVRPCGSWLPSERTTLKNTRGGGGYSMIGVRYMKNVMRLPDTIGYSATGCPKLHAQYDWTTGAPDNGNERRKFRGVPCLYPLPSLVLYFVV